MISGIAQRPSTPTPQYRHNNGNHNNAGMSLSAPNSPMNRSHSHNNGKDPSALTLQRLPSQDSLDRSIHNDSGHGNKSTAQVIRDLRQSNSRLTARTAALEADFMNQLNEVTRQYEDKQQKLEETLLRSEKLASSLEHRCQVAEGKLREKDDSLQRLREESAFQRHTISDLRTQLDWAENRDSHGDWQEEKETLTRELDLVKEEAKAESQEKEHLQEQLAALRRGEGGASLSEALRQTQATLEQVREQGQTQRVEHEKQVSYWKDQLDRVQQTTDDSTPTFEYSAEKEEKKQAEDNTPSMRHQVEETKRALEASRKELEKVKAQAEHEEQYRREEADDLRLLNDAQEEEIERLKKDLDEAVKELEIRDQELEESRNHQDLRDRQEDEMVMEESSTYLSDIQQSLEESRRNFEQLETEFTETREAKEGEIHELSGRLDELLRENQRLQKLLDSRNTPGDGNSVLTLRAKGLALEEKNAKLERSMREMKGKLEEAERYSSDPMEAQEKIESEYQAQLVSKETEVAKLKEQLSTAVNNAEGDKARIAELTDERLRLEEELEEANRKLKKAESNTSRQQSGGEYEEDLRKEVTDLRETRKELRAKVEALEDELESSQGSLRNKLADRDTTISALVKSNVSLEQEVSAAKIELQLYRARLSRSEENMDEEEGVDVILAKNEEVATLRDSLAAYKETESHMSQELSRLEKQLSELKWENIRLRRRKPAADTSVDDASATGSVTSSVAPYQIKERDEAIARLVKQTVTQDKDIATLRSQIEKLTKELDAQTQSKSSPQASHTEKEVEQLRQESEMFAGQVIELDEEIENLRCALDERNASVEKLEKQLEELQMVKPADDTLIKEKDDKIAALLNEVNDLKSRPMTDGDESSKITRLEAEVDELREAYDEQMSEVRTLRRTARNAEQSSDELAKAKAATAEAQAKIDELRNIIDNLSSETESLKKELEDAKASSNGADGVEEQLRSLREEIAERDRQIEELKYRNERRSPVPGPDEDEFEMESMKEEVTQLRRSMANQSEDLDNAKQTIRELERMVAEKNEDAMAQWEEEKDELMGDIEDLTQQLEETRQTLADLEKERNLIDDFKQKLEQADEEREQAVKHVTDTYERKLSLLTLDKDVTIDKLRKELVAAKEGSSADVDELQAEIEQYRAKLDEVGEQATAEIEQRDSRIFALENTLDASKQLVSNMRTEMDHLQGSMEDVVADRKEEIEDMQQELVDLTSTSARQERELGALRMKLEEKHLAHEAEVARLQETISKLEGEKAHFEGHRTAHDMQMDLRVREVKEKLEKLKWRNSSLQEENESLRQRISKLESNSNFVERDKYEKLQMDFSEQKKEMKRLQTELEETRSVVVTAPPTLPPGSSEKSKGKSSRRGFLGRRRGNADESSGVV